MHHAYLSEEYIFNHAMDTHTNIINLTTKCDNFDAL